MKLGFQPTQAYSKDTGLVIVLVLLLTAYWMENLFLIPFAIGILVGVMTVPIIFKPLAVVWYYFSITLGSITNRIILTVIFWVVLTPIGIIRRSLGFDPMKQKAWKNGLCSVFTTRNQYMTPDDLKLPY
jgi:hypothetical protein